LDFASGANKPAVAIVPLPVVVGLLQDLAKFREQLIAENALLRQQPPVASRNVKRPVFKARERGLLALLSRIVRGWRNWTPINIGFSSANFASIRLR
jgi:hypothetical protein